MFFLLAELFISFFASVPVIEMTNKEFANYYYNKMKFLIYTHNTGDQNDVHSPWQDIVLHQHVKHAMSFKKRPQKCPDYLF